MAQDMFHLLWLFLREASFLAWLPLLVALWFLSQFVQALQERKAQQVLALIFEAV
jgi:hypothetical protein